MIRRFIEWRRQRWVQSVYFELGHFSDVEFHYLEGLSGPSFFGMIPPVITKYAAILVSKDPLLLDWEEVTNLFGAPDPRAHELARRVMGQHYGKSCIIIGREWMIPHIQAYINMRS